MLEKSFIIFIVSFHLPAREKASRSELLMEIEKEQRSD